VEVIPVSTPNAAPLASRSTYSALAGIAAILFGLVALFWPSLTLYVFVLLFGIFAIATGIIFFASMVRAIQEDETWWPQLILGLIGIGAGIFVFTNPQVSTYSLLFVIALWAIFAGVIEILAGIMTAEFLLLIAGIVTSIFGFILLAHPQSGAMALVMGILLLIGTLHQPSPAEPA
jgi:uncharacterized membrane protein HdeD (DUF308 family)